MEPVLVAVAAILALGLAVVVVRGRRLAGPRPRRGRRGARRADPVARGRRAPRPERPVRGRAGRGSPRSRPAHRFARAGRGLGRSQPPDRRRQQRRPTRSCGARQGALIGRTVIEAFLDAQVEAIVRAALDQGSATGEIGQAEADGRRLLVRARRSSSGGAWLVLEDVSELRRLQQIRAEFIDNLSHELRTPLTTVSLLAETLTREADAAGAAIPAKMRDRIGKIEVETGHLVQMVSELLDLSRIESGGTISAVDLLDLGQIATESTERLRLFADRQGVALRVDVARNAAAGPRRRGPARAGVRQPAAQRGQVQPRWRRRRR